MSADLYILVGFPGSGKTTWGNNKAKEINGAILSTDELSKVFKNMPKEKRKEFELFMAKEHLKRGTPVIIDKMVMTKESRKKIINALKPYANKIYVVLFDVPLLTCMQRNSARDSYARVKDKSYISHIKKYEPPSKDEGYDTLITVNSSDARK